MVEVQHKSFESRRQKNEHFQVIIFRSILGTVVFKPVSGLR